MSNPLSARIRIDPEPLLPAGPGQVTWRRATADDVAAITDLEAELAGADHPEWSMTAEEIAAELAHSWVDLDRDSAIAEREGRVVAYGVQIAPPAPETVVRSIAMGGVRPSARRQGIGRALLDWHRHRGRQQLAASDLDLPGWNVLYAEELNEGAVRLATRAGMPLVRWFTSMSRDLTEPIPDLELPDGLTLAIPDTTDLERIRAARNESFRDHWGSQPTTEEAWAAFTGSAVIRLDLSVVALDGDRVAGVVLSQVNPDDFELQGFAGGYIPLVGVVRDWRRRGVAPALLAAAMKLHRTEGLEKVVLDVDSENPSGALGLYTGMGFQSFSRSVAFVEEF